MQDLSQLMDGLSGFLGTSYTAYNAADNARAFLRAHGFCELDERAPWTLAPQGKYFVVRGGSAVIAFTGGDAAKGFKIVASHTDSYSFFLLMQKQTMYLKFL